MHRKGIILGGIVMLLLFGVFLFVRNANTIELTYRLSPELGDEIVIVLGSLQNPDEIRETFRIVPPMDGDLVWIEEERELRFLPVDGFASGREYVVSVGPKRSKLQAALQGPGHVLTFITPTASGVSLVEPLVDAERYIDVNLSTMQITLVEGGKPFAIYPLAAIGSPYTSRTREGTFSVLSKETNHLSTIYKVWMPLAIRYSGPYFIHAWPYWPGGQPIRSTFSGGCIRMFDHDMREIYDWARVGDPFVVHSTPARTPAFTAETVDDGDLVRIEGDDAVYVLKEEGGERYKRHVLTDQFEDWYPHLKRFWPRVKAVVDATALDSYTTSRWVLTETTKENGQRYVYEIRAPGIKHLILCGDPSASSGQVPPEAWRCESVWEAYGWSKTELFVAADEELAAYADGDPIVLTAAP